MSEMAKAARAAMKNKAKRLGTTDPSKKVDASSWTPPEPLNADVKTGLRPVSRRAYKKGGKVEGQAAKMHAGRKPRKSGGEASMYANAKINRNVKDANDEREGTKHIGGMKKGGRARKEGGGGLYEGNKRVVSPTATRAAPESKSSAPQNAPMPPRRPADLPRDKGMTAEEAQKFMDSRKRGGRTKREYGGPSGSGYEYMSMHTTPKEADEYMTRQYANEREPNIMSKANRKAYEDIKRFKEENKQMDLKRGGRAKKQMGGMLPNDPRLDIVKRQAMNFQGNPVTPGAKKGGKIERHPDEAMDKALIKKMVRKEARTGKAHGGMQRMNRKDGGMALDGEIQGTRPTGGRLARANGGADENKNVGKRAKKSPFNTDRPMRDQTRQAPNRSAVPGRDRQESAVSASRPTAPAPQPAAQRAAAMMDSRGGSPVQGGTMGPGNIRPLPASPMMGGGLNTNVQPVAPVAPSSPPSSPMTGGPSVAAPLISGGTPLPPQLQQRQIGPIDPAMEQYYAADRAAQIQRMQYYQQMGTYGVQGVPVDYRNVGLAAPQSSPMMGGGYPMSPMMGGGYPMSPMMGVGYPSPPGYVPPPQVQRFPTDDPPPPPTTGGGYPLPSSQPQQQPQQAQAAPSAAPAQPFKRGGRAKGKTDINIVIAAGPKGGPAMPPGMMPPAGPPMAPPPPPQMGAGGPPGGAPPMPPGPPMGMPMGGPPGMPPGMGMPRKSGGRITPKAKSFADMKAGAGSGEGRLQKTDIAEYKRGQHRAGGKVYRTYKDMDAGAGSGLGRLEKTEIQSRKR